MRLEGSGPLTSTSPRGHPGFPFRYKTMDRKFFPDWFSEDPHFPLMRVKVGEDGFVLKAAVSLPGISLTAVKAELVSWDADDACLVTLKVDYTGLDGKPAVLRGDTVPLPEIYSHWEVVGEQFNGLWTFVASPKEKPTTWVAVLEKVE